MIVTLLDTIVGQEVTTGDEFGAGWWSEGNGSCDCNRMSYFGREPPDGTCAGCHRYLIVWASTGELTLRELNLDYPEKLLRRCLTKEGLQ